MIIKLAQVAIWANAGTVSPGPPVPAGFGRGGALVVANFLQTHLAGESGRHPRRELGGSPGWRWGSQRPRAVPAFLPAGSRLAGTTLCRDRGCLHLPSACSSEIRCEPRSKETLSPSRQGLMTGFADLLSSPPQNPSLGSEESWGAFAPR